MELKGKKVMVLGLARTGSETARFLVRQGAEVQVTDCRAEEDLQREVRDLSGLPIRYLFGDEQRGIEILSEIELAYRFLHVPLVAITGTNGKSTTTSLIGEIFKTKGLKTFVGGNIGNPLIGMVSGSWDWGVAEVSSFQLEWVEGFRPKIAVLLNLTEDHLDRYQNFASYRETKERIFAAQGEGDFAVLNRDDPLVWSMKERIRARVVSFGWSEVPVGVYGTRNEIVWKDKGEEEKFTL